MPHSEFLGWDENDQDLALAYQREAAKVCDGCATRREDWERDRFAHVAKSWQCPGCELLAMERSNVPEGLEGVKTYLVPRERGEAAKWLTSSSR